jgi:hypothetical protein
MGIVIRTLYTNQDWQAPCKNPGKDSGCWLCFEDIVDIKPPSLSDEVCTGHCWEQHLCNEYKWGCTPKGRRFGNRAYPGMKVFFVFKQRDGKYTLWGVTKVQSIDDKPMEEGKEYEVGYTFIHFNPFEPLPRNKWLRNLSDVQLVGEKWLMGRHRYIDTEREAKLEQLVEGIVSGKEAESLVTAELPTTTTLNVNVAPNVYKKLKDIADEEGREIDEIVREAMAEWLKGRGL